MTKNLEGLQMTDIGLLKENGAVAISDDGFCIQDAKLMYEIMKYARQFEMPLILHEEDYSFSKYGLMHEGYYSSKLGLEGISSLSEVFMIQRDISLALSTKARVHFTHLSTKESVELIRKAKEDGADITCDVTPHHLYFDDSSLDDYNALFKVNPPLRSSLDRQALVDGIKNGIIDIIASDHAPHLEAEKNMTIRNASNGVTGMETIFSASHMLLCKKDNYDLNKLINMLSCKPYKILGLKQPAIEPGSKAEITLIDTEREIQVNSGFFSSKSTNNAFKGKSLKGGIFAVINGRKIRVNS
jgi:dihydroorotase